MRFSDAMSGRIRELFPHGAHVVGGGVEGLSTVRFLAAAGVAPLVLRDRNPEFRAPEGIEAMAGDGYLEGIPSEATVMRSAGIRPDLPAFVRHRAAGGRVLSQLRLFLALYRAEKPTGRVVGVTATMGKGTICTILSGMLDEAAVPHALLGNIGKAMLDLFLEPAIPDAVVLELSSFQLFDLGPGDGVTVAESVVDVALFGHVTLEHLDWHKDQIEYWDAKANLAAHQTEDHWAVHLDAEPGSVFCGMASDSMRRTLGEAGEIALRDEALVDHDGTQLLRLADLKVPGVFQLENCGLAWLAARCLELPEEAILRGAKGFAGLRHRLMWAGEAKGIRYYNDSYATRPEATLAAAQSLSDAPLALILGGSDKGVDFAELAAGLRACAGLVHVSLIGATAGRLREAFEAQGVPPFALADFPGLEPALEACEAALPAGGAVLLSPACASFGLFANYKERGEAFLRLAAARTGVAF